MGDWRRLGRGLGLVWLGAILGLVLGTAALELRYPDLPTGVRFVVWSTVIPAPVLFTIWFNREGRLSDDTWTSDDE